MVTDNKVNLTLGFFASLARRNYIMKATYGYFTTNLVWIVPPGKPQSALKKLLNPMEPVIWTILSISFFIGLMVIAYLKFQPKKVQNFVFGTGMQSPAMNLINIILGNSLAWLPGRNFSRFLLIIFTLYCFILRSSYQGGLVKFMQQDTREQKLMSTREIVDRGYTFYLLNRGLAYLHEMPTVRSRAKVINYADEFNQIVKKLKDSQFDGVFLSSLAHLSYRNMLQFPDFLNYAPESIFAVNLVIYLQKDSCLNQILDPFLVNLVSSGLINKWSSSWIDYKYLEEPVSKKLQILSLKQLEGAFQLLIGGLLLASIAFCAEISLHKLKILCRN